jgi:hypothetical protein
MSIPILSPGTRGNPFLSFLASSIPLFFDCRLARARVRPLRISSIHENESLDLILVLSDGVAGRIMIESRTNSIRWLFDGRSGAPGMIQFLDSQATRFTARFYRLFSHRIFSLNTNGYVQVLVPPGFSMIAHHLEVGDDRIGGIIPDAPEGTTVYKFDANSQIFRSNTFRFGGWETADESLAAREGAFLMNPTAQPMILRFVGNLKPSGHRAPAEVQTESPLVELDDRNATFRDTASEKHRLGLSPERSVGLDAPELDG